MSIVHSLKKLLDPMQARVEEAERKRQREQKKRETPGEPPRYSCRMCDYVGEEPEYCPRCLAPTMEPAAPSTR